MMDHVSGPVVRTPRCRISIHWPTWTTAPVWSPSAGTLTLAVLLASKTSWTCCSCSTSPAAQNKLNRKACFAEGGVSVRRRPPFLQTYISVEVRVRPESLGPMTALHSNQQLAAMSGRQTKRGQYSSEVRGVPIPKPAAKPRRCARGLPFQHGDSSCSW